MASSEIDHLIKLIPINSSNTFVNTPSKELNSLIQLADEGLKSYTPELIKEGEGGAYYIKDVSGNIIAIFKPEGEDPVGCNNPKPKLNSSPIQELRNSISSTSSSSDENSSSGNVGKRMHKSIPSGQCTIRELAAWIIDKGWAGVPLTAGVEIYHTNTNEWKIGSLHKYIPHKDTSWNVSPGKFEVDNVHRIAILDLRLGNTDRHGGNLIVCIDNDKNYKVIPIDHSYCFPTNLNELNFEWVFWNQTRKPFSKDTLQYIMNIDLEQEIKWLMEIGLDRQSLIVFKRNTLALQIGAKKGLNLYQIVNFIRKRRGKSLLEQVNSKVLTEINENLYDAEDCDYEIINDNSISLFNEKDSVSYWPKLQQAIEIEIVKPN